MTKNALLKTKLSIPPLQSNLIERSALIKKMKEGERKKIITVTAPAGYGKSTLLVQWVTQLKKPVAWISLDKEDNDSYTFLSYFIASIMTVWPDFGKTIHKQLHSSIPPDYRTILVDIINEISERDFNLYLFLDDFHNISNEKTIDLICFLITYLPSKMHLVIASREEVTLGCTRLRATGELHELTESDLRFNYEEARKFLQNSIGDSINEINISSLIEKTEGWVTGLKLISLAAEKTNDLSSLNKRFSGQNRFICDYLLNDVLEKQEPGVQEFLISTGFLDRFSSELCDAILVRDNSSMIINLLESKGLFLIPLDMERVWFRYHHLFGDFLTSQNKDHDEINQLSNRAAEWYVEHGMDEEAINIYLSIENFANALDLIEKIAIQYWGKGKFEPLDSWVSRIPEKMLTNYPSTVMTYAWLTFLNGEYHRAYQIVESIDLGKFSKSRSELDRRQIIGQCLVIKSVLSTPFLDPELTLGLMKEVGSFTESLDSFWLSYYYLNLGWVYEKFGKPDQAIPYRRKAFDISKKSTISVVPGSISARFLSIYLYSLGNFDECLALCREALSFYQSVGFSRNFNGIHNILMGCIAYHRMQYDDAELHLEMGIQQIERDMDEIWLIDSLYMLIKVKVAKQEIQAAQILVKKIEKVFQNSVIQSLIFDHYEVVRRSLAHILDQKINWQPEEGRKFVKECLSSRYINSAAAPQRNQFYSNDTPILFSFEFERITFLQSLLVKNDLQNAKNYIELWQHDFQSSLRCYDQANFFLLAGNVFFKLDLYGEAIKYFSDSLLITARMNFPQLIRENATFVTNVFDTHKTHFKKKLKPEDFLLVEELLTEIKKSLNDRQRISPKTIRLTPREKQIVLLASRGMTNDEIAETLVTTENTVRTHIKNINHKVGAKNRAHMIARCFQLELM